jgi:hydroxyacid-oxoacid transhydrogenase
VLADAIRSFLEELGDQPRGLRALGFGRGDVAALVEGTIPQARVLGLAPGFGGAGGVLTSGGAGTGGGDVEREREVLGGLFEEAMEY